MGQKIWLNEVLGLRVRIIIHFMKDVNVPIHFMSLVDL